MRSRQLRGSGSPLLLFLLAFVACQAAGDASEAERVSDRPGPVSRDSAGITIVESSGPVWRDGAGWRLSSEPALRIGSLDGRPGEQLYRVRGGVRLSDGRIAIANAGSHEVRWYGPDGRHLRSAGGEGEGPGEFRQLGSLFRLPGDSLLAWDFGIRRVSLFSPEGDFVRSFRLPELEGPIYTNVLGVLSDGRLLVGTGTVFTPGSDRGIQRPETLFLAHREGTSGFDTLVAAPGMEFFVGGEEGGVRVGPSLFGRNTHSAVQGDRLLIGDNDRYEIRTLAPDGRVERLVRRAWSPVTVRTAHVEKEVARRLEGIEQESFREGLRRDYARMPVPETFPAFSLLRIDASGHRWVGPYPVPGEERASWEVFDPEGRLLGGVEMPPGFVPGEIGEDYVLGLRRDELEVEYVELYALEKP